MVQKALATSRFECPKCELLIMTHLLVHCKSVFQSDLNYLKYLKCLKLKEYSYGAAWPSFESKMFAGLMSQCTMPTWPVLVWG